MPKSWPPQRPNTSLGRWTQSRYVRKCPMSHKGISGISLGRLPICKMLKRERDPWCKWDGILSRILSIWMWLGVEKVKEWRMRRMWRMEGLLRWVKVAKVKELKVLGGNKSPKTLELMMLACGKGRVWVDGGILSGECLWLYLCIRNDIIQYDVICICIYLYI